MARSKADVVRVEVLMPPALADAVRRAARRAGLKVGTWVAAQCAAVTKTDYAPPPLGRTPKPTSAE